VYEIPERQGASRVSPAPEGSQQRDAEDQEYFRRGASENPRFWTRHGGMPDLRGASVLDIGCGHGSLCIDMALAGAARVVGLDIDDRRVTFANANLNANFPQLRESVRFENRDLRDHRSTPFDFIVSKDTFEHLLDVPGALAEIAKHLRPGGRAYIAAGPLYNSPYGDHGRTRAVIPWGHVIIPERLLLARLRRTGHPARSVFDLGLNKLALRDYRRLFNTSGMRVVRFSINESDRLISRIFAQLRKVPLLEELCSHNLYSILEKPKA
jgi:2-polyprenyl-3-methyl-5-hydroxy-6-metoxy-1,4-benzoquinol methylase